MIECKFEREELELLQMLVGTLKSTLYPLSDKSPKELSLFYKLDNLDFKLRFILRDGK
ncbi:MAG: hypothetical protein J6J11_08120 [Treponema sp.]|nr:hypothetical protein [Treponema sp.]